MSELDIEDRAQAESLSRLVKDAVVAEFLSEWRQDSMNPAIEHIYAAVLRFTDGRELQLSALGWHGIESLIVVLREEDE